VHADRAVVAVSKPLGMLTQADRSGDTCALEWTREWIRIDRNKPGRAFVGMVHRLDRGTSGLLLFACTSRAASRLSMAFRTRAVHKEYFTVVHGKMEASEGTLRHVIARQSKEQKLRGPSRSVVLERLDPTSAVATQGDGQDAALKWTVRHRWRDVEGHKSLLQVQLLTGRRHQIRAQLAAVGCPVVGDLLYGGDLSRRPTAMDRVFAAARGVALHSAHLCVDHPSPGEPSPLLLSDPLVPGEWKQAFGIKSLDDLEGVMVKVS